MISEEIVKHVAALARLSLSKKEVKKFTKELGDMLEAFKVLDEPNTEKVKPAFHPLELKNIMREDKVEEGLTQEGALKNTKHKENGYFKGPRIV